MSNLQNEQTKRPLTALDDYINRVYRLVLLLVPGACQCAGILYTFFKFMGWLPGVSWTALIIFDVTCLIYLAVGIVLVKLGVKDGIVKPSMLKAAKIYMSVLLLIQFNFILYMIPAADFWGFAFFFVVLTSFLLDYKVVLAVSLEIAGSLAVGWIFFNDHKLPVADEYFIVNMMDRIVAVALSLPTLVLLIYLVRRFLVNAKKDEMERNNARVQTVLSTAQELSQKMLAAGTTLTDISASEATSAEELSTTGAQLLENSNALRKKAALGIENLNELKQSGTRLSENVGRVGRTSGEIMNRSTENEKTLNSLRTVNEEVSRSMEETNVVAGKLSEAVKGIDAALKLISDIAMQTNILSLNASIEAARAGAAGKGFAVVSHEVGNLAGKTSESLAEIQRVMGNIQQNVTSMISYVQENSERLNLQNEYFSTVFTNMSEMNTLLQQAMTEISAMSTENERQTEIITHTYDINADIAESIETENREFSNITKMVENNAKDALKIENQVASINQMVEQIDELLK